MGDDKGSLLLRLKPWLCLGSLALALLVVHFRRDEFVQGISSIGWSRVPAVLTDAGYHAQHGRGDDVNSEHQTWVTLSYGYSVGGKHYSGGRYDVSSPNIGDKHVDAFSETIATDILSLGPRPWIYFDPARPERSVLVRGIPATSGGLFLLVAFLGFGLGWPISTRHVPREWPKKDPHLLTAQETKARETPPNEKSWNEGALAGLVFWTFLVAFLGLGCLSALYVASIHLFGTALPWPVPLCVYGAGIFLACFPKLVLKRPLIWLFTAYPVVALAAIPVAAYFTMDDEERNEHREYEPTVQEIIEGLSHPNPHVAYSFGRRVARSGGPKESLGAIETCLRTQDSATTPACAAAAGGLGAEAQGLLPLLEELRDERPDKGSALDNDYRSSFNAAMAKIEIDASRSAPPLPAPHLKRSQPSVSVGRPRLPD